MYTDDIVVMEDAPFSVHCRLSSFETLKWQKDGFNIVPSQVNNITLNERTIEGGIEAELSVSHAKVQHTGHYRCNSFHTHSQVVYVVSGMATLCAHCLQPKIHFFELTSIQFLL